MKRIVFLLLSLLISGSIVTPVSADSTWERIKLSNGDVVKFSYEELSNGFRYEVRFENGRDYWYEETGNTGRAGGSGSLTSEETDMAEEALEIYKQNHAVHSTMDEQEPSGSPIGILMVLFGVIATFSSRTAWYLEIGWKLRGAEPSDLALGANRVGGVIVALLGLFAL
ncbi:hypothetical protein H0266_14590 [Halobacillus locisalis]|uniref:DUF6199 domain-containing protein n=1 Tax=Halobacillus locisalis TaxID=220753 RepID=A0A838CVF9_9BACI|nr:DUF6199 family natural product biosynthesis protein [Halobacillus locisalis]MBA2176122.1 hypothetical protein [Halobacillus locisalis]